MVRAARQRREVSLDLDTDGLSLVILSSGVQEGRPTTSHASRPSLPCEQPNSRGTEQPINARGATGTQTTQAGEEGGAAFE